MRILMLLSNTIGKGTYWRGLFLARGLAKSGHTVYVVATSRKRRFNLAVRSDSQAGVTLVETPDLLWGSLRSGWDLWNTLSRILWSRHQEFDLVHAFEARPTAIFPAIYWQRRKKTKLILDWCDWFGKGGSVEERPSRVIRTILRPVETFFEDTFRTWADGTTVINTLLKQRATKLGVSPHTIMYLPNGSNIDELYPIPQSDARETLGWEQSTLIIGYIGAIFQRDAYFMAEAFNIVHQIEPRTRLVLVGYCNVAIEELASCPDAIERVENIHYHEISTYLSACDICWLPLRDSGANQGRFPLKINDYMAVGKPVVATKVGDLPYLIDRGQFGFISPDQPEEFAKQTIRLLNDPKKRMVMGMSARRLAETEFSWDSLADKLEQFYIKLLEKGSD